MVKKYVKVLEQREINAQTGSIWAIQDVPERWRSETQTKVISDGYHFDEDGTAVKDSTNKKTKKGEKK